MMWEIAKNSKSQERKLIIYELRTFQMVGNSSWGMP
jgi:hypothetical protein